MIAPGETLTFESGQQYRIGRPRPSGPQFEVYDATHARSGARGIVKLLKPGFDPDQLAVRTRFLMDQHLPCPPIYAPNDLYCRSGRVGHFALLAEGDPLEQVLTSSNWGLQAHIQLALLAAQGLVILSERGISHGDIHPGNLIVHRGKDGVVRGGWIDLCNFGAPGRPPPSCIGQELYLAPELRRALKSGSSAQPSKFTDRFALATLMSEIVLLRHPAAGADDSPEKFERLMTSGRWPDDPMFARSTGSPGGYPAAVLTPLLAQLFRRGYSLAPEVRPTCQEWVGALNKAMHEVFSCDSCGRPFMIDPSQSKCPYRDCAGEFPVLKLAVADGEELLLCDAVTLVGRKQLGGSTHVSSCHARFTRVGPEYWLEALGSNGTFRLNGTSVRLPAGSRVLVRPADRLRFADMEAVVCEARA